jgi:hypothetical protein
MTGFQLQLVCINWVVTPMNVPWVDAVCSHHGDWIRINSLTWLLWTRTDSMTLANAFREKLKPEDLVFVAKVDPKGTAGNAPKWVWSWINTKAAWSFRT